MSNKNYFELIDQYLDGTMSGAEKADFESQIQKDPLLQSEFQFQNDIVKAIGEYRKAELKATLNAVDVSVGGTFTGFKIAAGVAIILISGLSIYLFNSDNKTARSNNPIIENTKDENINTEKNITEEDLLTINSQEKENNHSELVDEHKKPLTEETAEAKTIIPAIPKEEEVNNMESSMEEKTRPKIILPQVMEDFEDEKEQEITEILKVPENKLSKMTETILPRTEVVEMKNKKYPFHYQFYNNKLFLYGEFENKYEILELNTPKGISLYMFYEENFYEIKQNTEKVTPLDKLNDSKLIKDLKTIKEN